MKRLIPVISLLLLLCSSALAQGHSAAFNWTASTTGGVAGYNVYRAPCTGTVSANTRSTEGTFTKLTASPVTGTSYTDASVTAGGLYSYYVTAVCPAAGCSATQSGESVGSSHLGVVIPKDPPAPPTGLSLTNVARNSNGANTTIVAQWTDAPNTSTTYTFSAGGTVLVKGTSNNASGSYSAAWSGKVKPGLAVIVQVCDVNKSCDSRAI